MISKEEASMLLIESCRPEYSTPIRYCENGLVGYGGLTEQEFIKFYQAIYNRAIEDAAREAWNATENTSSYRDAEYVSDYVKMLHG